MAATHPRVDEADLADPDVDPDVARTAPSAAEAEDLVRLLDASGALLPEADTEAPGGMDADLLTRCFRLMVMLRTVDSRGLNLQRQGRISFYAPSSGQEGAIIASALALTAEDWAFPSYRECGVCLTRGMPLGTLVDQLFGNARDLTRGRQMPNHWSSKEHRILSISSPIATQIPQAAGCGMAQKIKGEDAATICYFGDGATSEGDFHAGLNFAGVFKAHTVFFNQNNQWAITVPVTRQTGSPSIAVKAKAYGFPGIRVDGNDPIAVFQVTSEALQRARAGEGPTLIEALTYRMGAHSTSDDPRRYRPDALVDAWAAKDPIDRLERYLLGRGLIEEGTRASVEAETKAALDEAVESAEANPAPSPDSLFEDVYHAMPRRLQAQQRELQRDLDRGAVQRILGHGH